MVSHSLKCLYKYVVIPLTNCEVKSSTSPIFQTWRFVTYPCSQNQQMYVCVGGGSAQAVGQEEWWLWGVRLEFKLSFWTPQLTNVKWAPKHLYCFIQCKPRRRQLPVTYLPELALGWCCQVFLGLNGPEVSHWPHCALSHLPNAHLSCAYAFISPLVKKALNRAACSPPESYPVK